MEELNPVGKLAESYQNHPLLQALVNALPIGSSLDTLLKARAQQIAEERAREFFDELSNDFVELTPELIQSEEFIHRWVITAKAAINTRRRDKIRLFARLLKSSLLSDNLVTNDEYEEYLSILDELSYREFLILSTLERYDSELTPIKEDENDLARSNRFWNRFVSEIQSKFGLTLDELNAMLMRLTRTGCYKTFVGIYLAGDMGGQGRLTDTYFRIKKLLETELTSNS